MTLLYFSFYFQATSPRMPDNGASGPVRAVPVRGVPTHRPPGRRRASRLRNRNPFHRFNRRFRRCQAPARPPSPNPDSRPRRFRSPGPPIQITLALAPSSDRVVVTATGAPLALDEAGVAATVFTSADFAPAQRALRRGSAARCPRLEHRSDRAERRADQRCSPAEAIPTRRWCCWTAFRSRSREAPSTSPISPRPARSHGGDPRAGKRSVRRGSFERRDPALHQARRFRIRYAARLGDL